MQYAIQQFTCTKIGSEILKNYETANHQDLTADEIQSLQLIESYADLKASEATANINSVEIQFQELYLSVNLSRLVAMKLIIFKPAVNNNYEKEVKLKLSKSIKSIVKPLNATSSKSMSALSSNKDTGLINNQEQSNISQILIDIDPAIILSAGMD